MVGVGEGGRVQAGFEWLVIDCPSLFPIIHAWRVTLHCIENFYINFIRSPILPFFHHMYINLYFMDNNQ